MKARAVIVAGWVAAVLAAGCGEAPPVVVEQTPTGDSRFEAVWGAAQRTLREYRFVVDRADRRAGVITTFPLLSPHWFECWRADAVTDQDRREASLHTIHRRAVVTIRQGDGPATQPGAEPAFDVAVHVSRSNRPTLQVTSTADAYDLFFAPERLGRTEAASESGRQAKGSTVDLGRDEHLERVLRQRIRALVAVAR